MAVDETLISKYFNWSDAKIVAFQKALLEWYDRDGRQLPWRVDHDPYHVFVSEIMLQQTQVQTVIPYYLDFIASFPTVGELASAPESKLLKAWEGLGYYSRVRNMQKAAQQIMRDYVGQWPTTAAKLQTLTGIGPYTAAAIASIAFNQPIAAIDGNAFRVFARLLKIDLDISKSQTRPVFQAIGDRLISVARPGDFNQAIMDLGTSYLTAKQPDAEHSPVRDFDESLADGTTLAYPVKTKKAKPIDFYYYALAIQSPEGWLFEQRPTKGMLARLWMLPLINCDDLTTSDPKEVLAELSTLFQQETEIHAEFHEVEMKPVIHTFTHQKWHIQIVQAKLTSTPNLSLFPGKWLSLAAIAEAPLPTVQLKLNQQLFV